MPNSLRRFLVLLAALAPVMASAQTAPEAGVGVNLDSLARAFVDATGTPSAVVGVIVDGQRTIVGAGEVNGAAPDGHTLYEIASVTKVFTSVLLADAVGRGDLALDTPLADVLGAPVGAHADDPIRLVDLATHTSGLPRLDEAMDQVDGFDQTNPYALYDADALLAFLANARPATAPGATFDYSNAAVGALGYALGQHQGTTYGALLADRVLTPLGMTETYLTVPDSLAHRFAEGRTADGPIPAWSWSEPTVGAGGIRSTVADMLTFAQAALDPSATPLADALALTLESRIDLGPRQAQALGWSLLSLNGGGTAAVHEGGTYGSSSFLAVIPDEGLAVVVLANQSEAAGRLAVDVLVRLRNSRVGRGE